MDARYVAYLENWKKEVEARFSEVSKSSLHNRDNFIRFFKGLIPTQTNEVK